MTPFLFFRSKGLIVATKSTLPLPLVHKQYAYNAKAGVTRHCFHLSTLTSMTTKSSDASDFCRTGLTSSGRVIA
jgi:hypothetical protein